MKALHTEVVDTGAKRDTRGRRIATAEEKVALVRAYESSGLTQRGFAQREGVKYCTFTTWLARYRRARAKHVFAQVSVTRASGTGALEIALPDGVVVRGGDVEQLITVVTRLRRC